MRYILWFRQQKQEADERMRQAKAAKKASQRKQREEELYDRKAEDATRHAEKLRRNREKCKDRIAGDNNSNNTFALWHSDTADTL